MSFCCHVLVELWQKCTLFVVEATLPLLSSFFMPRSVDTHFFNSQIPFIDFICSKNNFFDFFYLTLCIKRNSQSIIEILSSFSIKFGLQKCALDHTRLVSSIFFKKINQIFFMIFILNWEI